MTFFPFYGVFAAQTITTAGPHGLSPGDDFSMDINVPDKRKWPRLVAFLLRRPPPTVVVRQKLKVTGVPSANTAMINHVSTFELGGKK